MEAQTYPEDSLKPALQPPAQPLAPGQAAYKEQEIFQDPTGKFKLVMKGG